MIIIECKNSAMFRNKRRRFLGMCHVRNVWRVKTESPSDEIIR